MESRRASTLSWAFPGGESTSYLPSENILRVIMGNPEALWSCFRWASSPEGHDYWSDRAKGIVPISTRDVEQLMIWYVVKRISEENVT